MWKTYLYEVDIMKFKLFNWSKYVFLSLSVLCLIVVFILPRKQYYHKKRYKPYKIRNTFSDISSSHTKSGDTGSKKDISFVINEVDLSFIIKENGVCRPVGATVTVDLLIIISSTPTHFEAREKLRSTWLTYSKNNTANTRYVFLLGRVTDSVVQTNILEESRKYMDIIQGTFVDSYRNLTDKTLMGFKWTLAYCSNARHIMKTDDDVFVNVPNMVSLTHNRDIDFDNSVAGHCTRTQSVERDKFSRSYISESMYSGRFFPPFCSGTGYMTSKVLVQKIIDISQYVKLLPLEDVYVGMCLKRLHASVKDITGFARKCDKAKLCDFKSNSTFTVHKASSEDIGNIWTQSCKKVY